MEPTNLKLNEESILLSPEDEGLPHSGVQLSNYSSSSAVCQEQAYWKEEDTGVWKMNNVFCQCNKTGLNLVAAERYI